MFIKVNSLAMPYYCMFLLRSAYPCRNIVLFDETNEFSGFSRLMKLDSVRCRDDVTHHSFAKYLL